MEVSQKMFGKDHKDKIIQLLYLKWNIITASLIYDFGSCLNLLRIKSIKYNFYTF